MYSFEGDYRRKPQQNLSGASKRDDKAIFLQHAQLERLKRQQQRTRHDAAVKIQAYIRSFMIRKINRMHMRSEFDKVQQAIGQRNLNLEELVSQSRKLLFFYNCTLDANRLIWILQHFLKHQQEIKLRCMHSVEWLWRLRWILRICMQYNSKVLTGGAYSLAIPLRAMEVFTTEETTEKILHRNSYLYLENIFIYLIKYGYFEQLRTLIDEKVPPMLQSSSIAPTPISKCLLDMVKRPLQLVSCLEQRNAQHVLILQEFCKNILSPKLSGPVKMFIIPALTEFSGFPFTQLLNCIDQLRVGIEPTLSLLYSILSLESKQVMLSKSKANPISYLQILASLSSAIIPPEIITDENIEDMEDSDSEYNMAMLDLEEGETLEQCINMINEQQHVYRILQVLDRVCQTSVFGGAAPLLQVISRGIPLSAEDSRKIVPLLDVFCSLFSLLIATLHDTEFFIQESGQTLSDNTQQAMPFTTTELVILSTHLKEVCLGLVELAFPDTRPTIGEDYKNALGSSCTIGTPLITHIRTHLFKVTVGLLRQLHTRDLRRPFCPPNHWITSNIVIPVDKPQDFTFRRRRLRGYVPFQGLRGLTREDLKEGPPLSAKEVRTLTLLREMPFVIPFNDRVVVFQSLIYHDKTEQQGEFTHFMQKPSIQVTVRRNYLYEDAFEKLSPENEPELRLKMRVQFVNTAGLEESGVDGGGLFREFLLELLKTSFDPNRGFFKHTKDNMLYPNPNVHLLMEDFPKHYYFIGRILGKALYENLLVELPFAEFFLSKIVGLQSDVDAHHLASLDPIMYTNLLSLKSYKGDVTDLELDFTVLSDELGEKRIDELKPSGANIPVTNHNRIEYIHLMADYKLNKQIRAQCYAFKQGIGSVVPLEWLQMFNNKELQVLISGAQIPVDVNDLKLHTNYTGGYTPDHPTITAFWKVVNEFNDQQKSKLLKFVTSCSRPPLLGFKELDPPFCIQHAGSVDRLPTSSTCMNLLKLPDFPNEKTLREKLLYAIEAGAGFELS
ncbi:hypothetical protein KPH14_012282 [Odynerus spinipes]|uniref:Ubiquitin-protein ligase E3C n=1 Tax=Odynerus spinipes TaxID=1348599 RepID=A0AAD9RFJ8_9HYME|nr:hypothetical protein KPH14_012282 [Odynerus spinipes]